MQEDERWRRERVSFAAAYGDERVLANILIPKNVIPPYQPSSYRRLPPQTRNSPGVFDKLTLLKMWAETTPRAIFPERKIRLLRDGYEASFLALNGNPLEDLGNVRRIRFRFKQGLLLP